MVEVNEQCGATTEVMDRLFAGGVVSTALLSPYKDSPEQSTGEDHARHSAAWLQVEGLDGRCLTGLSADERLVFSCAAGILLGLPEPIEIPSNLPSASEDAGVSPLSAEQAMARLDRLRLGQPDASVMFALSPRANQAMSFLHQRLRLRQPVVRLISGEMGEGKTTLAKSIHLAALEETAIPILFTLPRHKSFDVTMRYRQMVLDLGLLTRSIRKMAELALVIGDAKKSRFTDCFQTAPLSSIMHTVIEASITNPAVYADRGAARALAQECQSALTAWMVNMPSASRVMPCRDFLKRHGNQYRFSGSFNKESIPQGLGEFLAFYREVGAYPVWLFDEFESVVGLAGDTQKITMGFFRDAIDAVSSAEHGALFIFSTGDGQRIIRQYPALEDRLKSPNQWSLTSPTWRVGDFSGWEPAAVLEYVLALYRRCAAGGDPSGMAVVEHESLLSSLLDEPVVLQWLADTEVVPRERLKALLSVFDRAIDGADEVRSHLDVLSAVEQEPALPDSVEPFTSDMDDDFDVDFGFDIDIEEFSGHSVGEDDIQIQDAPGLALDGHAVLTERLFEPENPDDLAVDHVAKNAYSGLTTYGQQRARNRERLQQVLMPHQIKDATPPPKDFSDYYDWICRASTPAHLAYRLATLRDSGGTARDLWAAKGLQGQLDKHTDLTLLSIRDLQDVELMEQVAQRFMDAASVSSGEMLVAMPETRQQSELRKLLEEDDRNAIKSAKANGRDVWPFMRDRLRWPGCRHLGTIQVLGNIQVFRHALYSWFAALGKVPCDEWVDRFVLATLKQLFNYTPRTSRDGVQFIMPRSGLLGRFERRRTIAVEPPHENTGSFVYSEPLIEAG